MRAKRNPITIGEEFTRLTVIAFAGKNRHGQSMYECLCKCGNTSIVNGGSLRQGTPKSCGCLTVDSARAQATHGMARRGQRVPEYPIHAAMMQRCYNPNNPEYENYGERGIRVFPEWHDFAAFIRDVGRRPSPQHSLDRHPNNDGNYEPGNVRWTTIDKQNRNKRTNVMLTLNGETHCVVDWTQIRGFKRNTISNRLKAGWSVERALLTTPVVKRSD
jgi:hypothetical protein